MPCKPFASSPSPVRIFHADITEFSASKWMAAQHARLDQVSLNRAAEIAHVRRREQFLFGRILLKHALQHEYGATAASWRLEPSPGGKPLLLGPKGPVGVVVSLSHSGQRVVCALSECQAVGIDIERCKPRDFIALSEHVMTPAERTHLADLTPESQAEFFYQCWTAKEACAKALGVEQAPAFNLIGVCLPDGLISAQTGGEPLAGLCWGDEKYVTTLICKGAIRGNEVFHLGADGHFQRQALQDRITIWVRLPDTF